MEIRRRQFLPHVAMKKVLEKRKICDLKPYPLQAVYFTPPTKAEVTAMGQSLERNGLECPIDILPDGTILRGHTRVLGAEWAVWEEIDCWVRYDLLDQGEAAIERFFLEDNKNRRQLGRLELAHVAVRLAELENTTGRRRNGEGSVRNFLGEKFGLSGRTLDRNMSVLKAPLPIQHAWDKKQLSHADVRRVLESPEVVQGKIAERIANGELPKAVVNELAVARPAPKKKLRTAIQSIPRSVQRVYDWLSPEPLSYYNLFLYADELPALKKASLQLTKLVAKLDKDKGTNPLESVVAEIKKKL